MSDAYTDATTAIAAFVILGIILAIASVCVLIVGEHLVAMWAAARLTWMEIRREREER